MAGDGLITVQSRFGVTETIDRLVEVVKRAGLLEIDQPLSAGPVIHTGASLRPAKLLIFGNPPLGAQFLTSEAGMQASICRWRWPGKMSKARSGCPTMIRTG